MVDRVGLRCGAPYMPRVRSARWWSGASPRSARPGGDTALYAVEMRRQMRRDCANCVLLCTTRESARLWEKTGLFNLRLSSDAPNLQVENEETIEALSARTKALLDRIQQRFSFMRAVRATVDRDRFVGSASMPCRLAVSGHRARMIPIRSIPAVGTAHSVRTVRTVRTVHGTLACERDPSPAFFHLVFFFVSWVERSARCSRGRDRLRSFGALLRGALASRMSVPTTIDWSRPMSRQLRTRFLAKASGDQQ